MVDWNSFCLPCVECHRLPIIARWPIKADQRHFNLYRPAREKRKDKKKNEEQEQDQQVEEEEEEEQLLTPSRFHFVFLI